MLFLVVFASLCSGAVGDPGSERQRDVFPLPSFDSGPLLGGGGFSRSSARRAASKAGWTSWANDGIEALNQLSGFRSFSAGITSEVQSQVLDNIRDAYRPFSKSSGEPPPSSGALRELCGASPSYDHNRGDVKSYAEAKVAWPAVNSSPVPLGKCLRSADSEWLQDWQRMLRDPAEAQELRDTLALKRHYTDPILRHNRSEYGKFVRQMHSRRMIRFKVSDGKAGRLGIFFVGKKSGALRLFFDTRILNTMFRSPPKTDLPSAASFSSIESPSNDTLFMASGDLANAFYTLELPDDLAQ
jgi:hypothetical protein